MKISINKLLEKYFDGESTLKEEATLRSYFNENEVDPNLKPYAPLFIYFEKEKTDALDKDFDDKLLQKLENQGNVVKMRPARLYFLRIAAAAAILIGAIFFFQKLQPNETPIAWEKYEPETPEEAYEVTKQALLLLSSKLNKGSQKAATEVSKMDKISHVFK